MSRHTSRIVVGVGVLAFFAALLFIGPITSASPGGQAGRRPLTLSDGPNGNYHNPELEWLHRQFRQLSYKVRLTNLNNSAYNSLATVSQFQTTYTARFLPPNSNYAISVYAVDAKGNRSQTAIL